MSEKRYAIGLDYGTESGRAVLVDVTDGCEVATAVHLYGDGVIDEILPGLRPEQLAFTPIDRRYFRKRAAIASAVSETTFDSAENSSRWSFRAGRAANRMMATAAGTTRRPGVARAASTFNATMANAVATSMLRMPWLSPS